MFIVVKQLMSFDELVKALLGVFVIRFLQNVSTHHWTVSQTPEITGNALSCEYFPCRPDKISFSLVGFCPSH
jgi:hypothetical protein